MSVNPAPWREQLEGLEDSEVDEAVDAATSRRGTLSTRTEHATLDEDEDVTLIDAPAGHPAPDEPPVVAFPWAGMLLALVFWGSVGLALYATGAIR